MQPRENTLNRRLRSMGGRLLRRYHLLPGGMPDGLGDDEDLQDQSLHGDVIVYFADTMESIYQLRGWYGPLRALHAELGVTVVCMDSRVAEVLRDEMDMPVVTVALDATLDGLIARSDTKLILYVNYNPMNTAPLRSRSVIHVSLLHGDSDKGVSVSNQVKAYDYSFVAGQAAIDRYARYTSLFDAAARCLPVGRPALDTDREAVAVPERRDERPVVLYAPTWEGGQASVAYSSLRTHAETLLRAVQEEGARIIYRPHPLTGVRVPEFGEADRAVRELLAESGGHHLRRPPAVARRRGGGPADLRRLRRGERLARHRQAADHHHPRRRNCSGRRYPDARCAPPSHRSGGVGRRAARHGGDLPRSGP
ncbi:MAG: CDP-glycerol glycerophosphotransferase family protein [Brachybacterium sp.]